MPPSAIDTIDWSIQTDKVPCPLCDYDLRGLHEPRCPECGYRFHWPDLLDPTRRLHRFVFEHYPRRNIWSFFRTSAANFAPVRFWRSLLPSQPSIPRRLALYWFIQASIWLAIFLALYGLTCTAVYQVSVNDRAAIELQIKQNLGMYDSTFALYGSKQKYLDQFMPLPPSWNFFTFTFASVPAMRILALWMIVVILWPWLITLALMLYRVSMRQAKIRPIHVLRCAIYSGGATDVLLIGLLSFLVTMVGLVVFPTLRDFISDENAGQIGLAVMGITLMYRMTRAYRHYLRFDHATITVVLAQVIVLLALGQVMIMLFGYPQLQEMLLRH